MHRRGTNARGHDGISTEQCKNGQQSEHVDEYDQKNVNCKLYSFVFYFNGPNLLVISRLLLRPFLLRLQWITQLKGQMSGPVSGHCYIFFFPVS